MTEAAICTGPYFAETFTPACTSKRDASGTPDISFYCDDIEATVAELRARGVEFTHPVEDHGYGLVTHFRAPGGLELQLYQPLYGKG